MSHTLSTQLLCALQWTAQVPDDLDVLEDRLSSTWQGAQNTWPGVSVELHDYLHALARAILDAQTPPSDIPSLIDMIPTLHADDIFIARACVAKQSDALESFLKHFEPTITSTSRRFASYKISADDIQQSLFEFLFVGKQDLAPKIEKYTGTGPLRSWLKVTAARHCIDMTRTRAHASRDTPVEDDLIAVMLDGEASFELQFLKEKYRSEFKRSATAAIGDLDAEQRVLLRQSFIERQSIDALSKVHGLHRATIARRLQRAKNTLFSLTKKHMMENLEIDQDEFTSIFNMIQSNLDISIRRLLT